MELTLNYGHYNSILSEGYRVRRMRRTELSYDKICYLRSTKVSRPTSRDQAIRSPQRIKRTTSMPKLQSLYLIRAALPISGPTNELNLVQNEYYKPDPRPETIETHQKSLHLSPYISVHDLQNNSRISNKSKQSSKSHRKSGQSFLMPKSQLSMKSQSSLQPSLKAGSRSNSKNSQMFQKSHLQKQSFINSSKKEQSKVSNASVKKSQMNQNIDIYGIKGSLHVQHPEAEPSNIKFQSSLKNSSVNLSKIQKIPNQSKNSAFSRKKSSSQISKIASSSEKSISISRHSEYLNNESKISEKKDKISVKQQKQSRLENNLSSSQYMLKSSMLNSEMEHSQYFKKSKKSKKLSKINNSKVGDPIINSSGLKQQNWKQTIKSINIQQKQPSQLVKKKSINLGSSKNIDRNLSLKIDSVKNEGIFKSGRDSVQQSIKSISVRKSSKLISQGSEQPPCEDSIQDVLQRINLYETILQQIREFSLRMQTFDSTIEDQDIQILCFLLDKKYHFEKSNLLKCLKGIGKNVFILSSVQIPTQFLNKYLKHPSILQHIQELQKANLNFYKEFAENSKRIKSLTKGNPLIDTLTPNDKFTEEIVQRLWEKIQAFYNQISTLTGTSINEAEDFIIEMMELIFLFSNMRGRRVKRIEFSDFIEDFQEYFDLNIPKLESTILFFKGNTQ